MIRAVLYVLQYPFPSQNARMNARDCLAMFGHHIPKKNTKNMHLSNLYYFAQLLFRYLLLQEILPNRHSATLIDPSCRIHKGTSWGSIRKQTLRRSWNRYFQSWRSLSHLTVCYSMGLLVFSTQRLNNKYNYSSRESDKTIRNKLTIIDTSQTE